MVLASFRPRVIGPGPVAAPCPGGGSCGRRSAGHGSSGTDDPGWPWPGPRRRPASRTIADALVGGDQGAADQGSGDGLHGAAGEDQPRRVIARLVSLYNADVALARMESAVAVQTKDYGPARRPAASTNRCASFGPRPSSSCLKNTKARVQSCSRTRAAQAVISSSE